MYSLGEGGIAQYTYCLGDALQRNGSDVTVILQSNAAYDMQSFQHTHAVKLWLRHPTGRIRKPINTALNLSLLAKKASHADLFHCQWSITPEFDRSYWKLLRRRGIPIVLTAHNAVPHDRGNEGTQHSIWMQQNADLVIVHGENLKQAVIAQANIDPDNVHVIPHGNYSPIALQLNKWNRERARASFDLQDSECVILFFGYIKPYKGLDVLIESCEALKNQGSRFKLMIAGPADNSFYEPGNIADQLRKAGLDANTIRDVGYIPMENISRYFHAADIVAMPYRSGSQSGVLQLAYAYAKPVVVTDVGSITEVMEDQITGFVVPPEDADALANALQILIENPALAKQIGKNGHTYADTNLSWAAIANKTQQLYSSLIK